LETNQDWSASHESSFSSTDVDWSKPFTDIALAKPARERSPASPGGLPRPPAAPGFGGRRSGRRKPASTARRRRSSFGGATAAATSVPYPSAAPWPPCVMSVRMKPGATASAATSETIARPPAAAISAISASAASHGKRWVDDYKNRKLAALTSFPSALPNRPSIKAADSSPPAVCRA